jgi:hypothetical protein
MTTTALLPSENWLALPAVITPPGMADLRDRFERGVGTDALIAVDGDFARADAARGLVDHPHHGRHRHDLVGELAGGLRRGRAQLTAHTVFVLGFLGNMIALGHRLGGLQHVPVQGRLVLDEPWVGAHVRIGLVLYAGNALDTASDDHVGLRGDDALRRECDRL